MVLPDSYTFQEPYLRSPDSRSIYVDILKYGVSVGAAR